ncbi:unnamed protein product [Rodentolepis nana]|uniref:Calcium uptake protein 3, mitochondrial n=1 Tax=Rodentolepis nana TaxID=102285 RepID=A0A0R3TYY8_RODNA|nr:unnamed protein product [Rodentolepis nana]
MTFFRRFFTIASLSTASIGYFSANRLFCGIAVEQSEQKKRKVSKYDQQFRRFASCEYLGVLYMTPNDFLQSLFQDKAPVKIFHSLTVADVQKALAKPQLTISSQFFRRLGNKGLISFTDYLFLLALINEPSSRFEVIFDLLDADYSGSIDSNEFSMLYNVTAGVPDEQELTSSELSLYPRENLFEQSTLMQTLFGKDGKRLLKKEDFYKFIEIFQNEILEVEFILHSPNGKTISPFEFARILLQNTNLSEQRYDEFLSRLHKLSVNIEITIEDFKKFYKFINHLDDFQMAMKMYMLANKPISLHEFKRAIHVCTNLDIGEHVLQTLFCMFDADGDGHMSSKEFMVLFRNRRPRGIHKVSSVYVLFIY